MATIRLIPSTNYISSSNLTVGSANNMYANTDSTTYGTVTNTKSGTSSYYIYLRGFNFDDVPNNAIVSNISIKLKASHTGGNTSTIYCYDGTTQVAACGSTTALGTTASIKTFTNTTVDWDTLKSYGSDFGIRINCRRSSRNTQAVISIYGAEIEVTYTLPVYHNVSISGTNVSPTGTQSVLEGSSLTVKAYYDTKPTVTDNNVDVTNQVVQMTDSGANYDVENITTTYGFALNSNDYYESNNKGHSSSAAVCKVNFHLPVSATITFSVINYAEGTYDYGLLSNVDTTLNTNSSADSSNVYWSGQNHNSASVQTVTYSNVTAGDHYIYVKYFKDSYTDSNNDSLQFKVAITLNESFTPGTYWGYTLSNITADHTIVVSSAAAQDKLYVKVNGSWVEAVAVYKKVESASSATTTFDGYTAIISDTLNYIWQSDYTTPFQANETYRITWGSSSNVYTCQTFAHSNAGDGYAIGNQSLMGSGTNTNEPFLLYRHASSANTLIGGTTTAAQFYFYLKIEKLVGGSAWVEQTDLTAVFEDGVNYKVT